MEKKWNFLGWSRVNDVEFLGVLIFGLGISKSCYTIFQSFQGWNSVLCFMFAIYRGKVPNRNSKVFPSMFSTSCNLFGFSLGIAEIQSVINQEFWSFSFKVYNSDIWSDNLSIILPWCLKHIPRLYIDKLNRHILNWHAKNKIQI